MRAAALAALLAGCGAGAGGDGGDGDGDRVCGDGVKDVTEQCDGDDLGGQSCQSRGFFTGELGCMDTCLFDQSGCIGSADEFDLEGALGCEGVFNPDQVLRYYVEAGALTADGPGTFQCEDGPVMNVEVETKRGGGFKIDTNEFDDGQSYFGLKKLVFDTGGTTDLTDIVRQFLAWRMMRLSGAVTGRGALGEVYVNGSFFGVLVVIEAVDKTMMKNRFGDNDGWLYKKSGGGGDGLKTHESDGLAEANPYDDYLCFFETGNPCPVPGDLATELPNHLQIDQFLRIGAVNALIANSDSPIFKDNNYYYYDWPGKRAYLPWDLDTVMKDTSFAVVQDVSFASVLFTSWQGDYEQILAELVAGPLDFAAVQAELERVRVSAAAAIGLAGGDATAIADDIEAWWADRFAAVAAQM